MDANQLPNPDEARASLAEVAQTRRAAVSATQNPVWPEVVRAVVVGVYIGLLTLGNPTAKLVGVTIFVIGIFGLSLVQQRLAKRHGQLVDNRFIGAAAVRAIPVLIVLGFLAIREPPSDIQPWYSIGLGLATGLAAYAYMRWSNHYQARRLAANDYDRANLL